MINKMFESFLAFGYVVYGIYVKKLLAMEVSFLLNLAAFSSYYFFAYLCPQKIVCVELYARALATPVLVGKCCKWQSSIAASQ